MDDLVRQRASITRRQFGAVAGSALASVLCGDVCRAFEPANDGRFELRPAPPAKKG